MIKKKFLGGVSRESDRMTPFFCREVRTGIRCLQEDGSFCTSTIHNICYVRKMLLESGGILTLKGCYDFKEPALFCSREKPDDKVACCFEDNCNVDPSFEPVLDCCTEPAYTAPTDQPTDERGDSVRLAMYIIGPVLGTVLFTLFAALLFTRCRRKPRKSSRSSENGGFSVHLSATTEFTHHANQTCGLPLMMQRVFIRAIKQGDPISDGYFGRRVFIGEYQSEKVAVKTIACCEERLWSRELEIYNTAMLHHNNILALFAGGSFANKRGTELWLVTQYHCHGPLDSYLSREVLTPTMMLRMAVSIARGMAYLHAGAKPSVAHRNITSGSILVKDSLECCIADFSRSSIRIHGTVQKAEQSEILERFEVFVRTDVYALGLVLWELCSKSQVGNSKCNCTVHNIVKGTRNSQGLL